MDAVSQRRLLILEAAERLFHRYGPQKTTIADIAREARIGVGTVYLEFSSKDAIMKALSMARHHAVLAHIESAWQTPGAHADRLRRALSARVEAFIATAGSGHHAAELFHCGSPPIEAAHREYRLLEKKLFARFLIEGMRDGELATRDVELAVDALLTAYVAFSPPLLFRRDADSLAQNLAALHDLVLRGLLSR